MIIVILVPQTFKISMDISVKPFLNFLEFIENQVYSSWKLVEKNLLSGAIGPLNSIPSLRVSSIRTSSGKIPHLKKNS